MSRRSRKSKRKLNSLLWMLVLTAILLIFSTYAWFSVNKTVSLDNISAKVAAAEGLQISLDGENWSASIDISEEVLANLGTSVNNYTWPDELSPVSTVGTESGGNLVMYAGEVSADGSTLKNVATNTSNYIAFDVYFKNSSSNNEDALKLNGTSMVEVASTELQKITGLENCVRVGIVLYGNTTTMTAKAEDVRGLESGTTTVAIWEPNYNNHINEVAANDDRIANTTSEFTTLAIASASSTTIEGINATTADGNANLGAPSTIKTAGTVGSATDITAIDGSTTMSLVGNSISKARIFIWLEGQDPDCIDTASTGKQVNFTLSFTKTATTSESNG